MAIVENFDIHGKTKREIIRRAIVENIRSGKYSRGQRLPGGNILGKEYGVSAQTIHTVFESLQHEGLVERRHGSGTYVCGQKEGQAAIVRYPKLIHVPLLVKHILGHMTAYGMKYRFPVEIQTVDCAINQSDYWSIDRDIIKYFVGPNPPTFHYVSMIYLPWLVQSGVCEDLTRVFQTWNQASNVRPIAMDCITVDKKIYAFPGWATPTAVAYNKESLHRCGISIEEHMNSLDDFAVMLERLNQSGLFEHPWCGASLRVPIMYVLRYFYSDLAAYFGQNGRNPIEKSVGLEVLRFFKNARWKWNVYLIHSLERGAYENRKRYEQSFLRGDIPLSIRQFTRGKHYQELGALGDDKIDHAVVSWGKGRRQFSIYNMGCWVVNASASDQEKQFFGDFMCNYYSPMRMHDIDVRFIEEGHICNSHDVFISSADRITESPRETVLRQHLFDVSEKELGHHVPAFDEFFVAVRRILADPDASVEKEYDYYAMACEINRQV